MTCEDSLTLGEACASRVTMSILIVFVASYSNTCETSFVPGEAQLYVLEPVWQLIAFLG